MSASARRPGRAPAMRRDIKRTVIVLFGIAAAFYFAFILMSVLNAT